MIYLSIYQKVNHFINLNIIKLDFIIIDLLSNLSWVNYH